ncbi:MAG: PAS domain S-box protein [Haloarculaceae archaeon]
MTDGAASLSDRPTDERRVQLCVADDRNRELLAEWLAETYEVEADPGGAAGPFDLCVVDARWFAENRGWLADRKERAHPAFLPVVLVSAEPPGEDLDPSAWDDIDGLYIIDEIVSVPVEKSVLYRRLENLLERRDLSLQLTGRLQRTRERFRTLFDGTPDPVFVVSDDHVVQYVNDAFCERFGIEREAVLDTELVEFPGVSGKTAAAVGDSVDQALAGDPPDRAEITFRGGAGDERVAEINVSTIEADGTDDAVVIMRDVTDRRRREREVTESEQRFRALFEHSHDALLLADDDGEYVDANPAASELLGLPREDLLGMSIGDFAAGEYDFAAVWEQFLAEGRMRGEFPLVTADGDERIVEFNASANVRRGEHLSALRDVTERKEMERELRRSERRFEEIAANVHEVIWMTGADGGDLLYLSPGFEDLAGVDPTAIDGSPVAAIETVHPDDREMVREWYRRVHDSDVTAGDYHLEYRVRRPDGTVRWVETDAYPVTDEDGTVTRYVGLIDGITDLVERERRFNAIFNQTYQFMGLLEPDGRMTKINDPSLSFLDAERDAIVGESFAATVAPSIDGLDEAAVEATVEQAAAGEFVRWEVPIVDGHDSGVEMLDFSITPVTDEDGAVVLLIAEARDITELKRRERELQAQNERLDQFAGMVSHDLRNPLQAAISRLEMAGVADDPDEHVAEAERNLERIDRLITDILTLAREGEAVADPEPVSLPDVAAAWESVDADRAALDVAADRTIEADPDRVVELLENLFRNAVEHAGTDATVTVGWLADGDGFYVADDGPGVPPDEREAVFEMGHTTADEGTGFGLAIVREIAQAHGWTASVTEGADGGACFEFRGIDA